jgi:hypothetical protein
MFEEIRAFKLSDSNTVPPRYLLFYLNNLPEIFFPEARANRDTGENKPVGTSRSKTIVT